MSEILCSTGAIIGRPNGRDYRLLESLTERLNCDGFEFMMYDSWYEIAEKVVDTLHRINMYTPVMHCEKRMGELISKGGKEELGEALRLFEINCRVARDIKAGKLVVHLWDGVTSDSYFSNNVKAYPYLEEIAEKYQVRLLVENVVCSHDNPMKHWCELAEKYDNISFIFDTKMAAFDGQLDLLYEKEYQWLWREGHICHFHVNDYAGGYMDWSNLRTLPVGKGNIDFDRFFKFVHRIGYNDTFTVEATAFNSEGTVDVDMLNRQFELLKNHLKI